MSTSYRIFAAVAPGLEAFAAEEANEVLGVPAATRGGGIEFDGDLGTLWDAVTRLRLPENVRVRIGSFVARDFPTLEAALRRVQWHAWLDDDGVDIRVVCKKSRLYHSDAVAERVRSAISASRPPAPEQGADEVRSARLHVRVAKDRVTLSLDASGEPAHHRGWSREVAPASIRETLAAAVLRASSLADHAVLWDPFCGAGTFGLEWLPLVAGSSVFGARTFAIERWPSVVGKLPARPRNATVPTGRRFIGTDRDAASVASSRRNFEARGLQEFVTLRSADVREAVAYVPDGAAVVANLPYGKRLGDARPALAAFCEMLSVRPDLASVYALDGAGLLPKVSPLRWSRVARFDNRGLTVELLRLER